MNIIQLGTNNGNDHVNRFCKENSNNLNKVILVEPLPFLNEHIAKNYYELCYKSDITIYNKIIVPEKTEDTKLIYYNTCDAIPKYGGICIKENENDMDKSFCLSSINKEHIIKHYVGEELIDFVSDKTESLEIETETLNNIINNNNNFTIDYLFIDIEGLDFEVIYSIDLMKYNIKNIQVEYIHYKSNELVNLILYMKDHNYIVNRPIYNNDYDILFTKQ